MENEKIYFTLSELVRDLDTLARFKKIFSFNEYQGTITDLKEQARKFVEVNGDSKAFMSADGTAMLVTNYKKLNFKNCVAFNLRTLKKILDVLNDSKDEEITVYVSLDEVKPCVVTNSTSAVILAPIISEDSEETEAEAEAETKQETETQESEAEPVPATA